VTQGPESIYQQYLAAGKLHIQRCENCKTYLFFPRYLCPDCGSSNLAWTRASGKGTVYSTTVMRRRAEAGGDFNVCLVELEEGPRLMSRVEGLPPQEVKIGMEVSARIAGGGGEDFYLVFTPAGDSHGH
jgi:uncharacterized OB-fold protein